MTRRASWTPTRPRRRIRPERGGVRLGVVLLDSNNPGTQARQLLDEGFERVYRLPREHEPPIPNTA